ncbi:MAG: myo-inositol-1(or 4)-monophosphatase [Oceanospirillaceae bacterium]|jgi:myo-inositol-1(or 4)-monophosphatase
MQPMLNIALRAARLASEQVQRAQDRLEIIRSEISEVTELIEETTLKTEQTIVHTIQKAYPNHALQGQFSGDYASLGNKTEATWYMSAIDNLGNFSKSLPQIAVCLAAVVKGKVEHAIIINPVTGEEFTASRGYGSVLNGRRIRVADNNSLEGATIATNFNDTSGDVEKLNSFIKMTTKLHASRGVLLNSGSAALNFANAAAGRIDGSFADNLQQATVLSAALIVQEAGGLAGDLAGGANFKKTGELITGNSKVFRNLVQAHRTAAAAAAE